MRSWFAFMGTRILEQSSNCIKILYKPQFKTETINTLFEILQIAGAYVGTDKIVNFIT